MNYTRIIDKIFLRIVLLIIIYIALNFYTNDLTVSILVSVGSIAVIELFIKILQQKPSKRKIKKAEILENENLHNQLILNSDEENLTLFLKAFENYNAKINGKNIEFLYEDKSYTVFLNLSFEHLTKHNLITYYKCAKALNKQNAIIFTHKVQNEVLRIIGSLDIKIKIFDDFSVYRFLKEHNALPEIEKTIKQKKDYALIFKMLFARKNFKGYFLMAIVLFLFSFITPYKLYYRISVIVLLLFCMICLIRNSKTPEQDF